MNAVMQSLWLSVLVEVSLALVGVVGVWSFFSWRRRQRDVAAAQTLVDRIRRDDPERLSQMIDFVSRVIQGQNPTQIADRVLEEERSFYKRMIHVYLNRDAEAFASLPDLVDLLGESYRSILLQANIVPGAASVESTAYLGEEEVQSSSHELHALREERDKLKDQLRVTLGTMHRIIEEYASMYGRDASVMPRTTSDQLLEALMMIHGSPQQHASEIPSPLVPKMAALAHHAADQEAEPVFDIEDLTENPLEDSTESAMEDSTEDAMEDPMEDHMLGIVSASHDFSSFLDQDDLLSTSSEEHTTTFPPEELSIEDHSIDDLMQGIMDPNTDPFSEMLAESDKDASTKDPEEFSWDNALLTDASDFDVLQLEEVSLDARGPAKPDFGSSDNLRGMVKNAEESLRGTGIENTRKRSF